jgi:hypothetical protein
MLLVALACGGFNPDPDDPSPDTLVLCPGTFRSALQPWVDYRQRQGHQILVIAPAKTAYAIHQQIKQLARLHPLRHLVIVGDAVAGKGGDPGAVIPADYQIAMVNVQFGAEPDIATDNTYADLDGDGLLDLTLGRIPVDTSQQLREFVQKVIAYETSTDHDLWRRRINLVAGVGNFDPLIDKMIENTSRRMITDLVPASYETSMTMTNWQSAYCPNPLQFSETVVRRLNEGCLFWVYIGHGWRDRVAPMQVGRHKFPVLDTRSAAQAHSAHGSPIAILLACYTGAFDQPDDCLAEVLVCQGNGPVACLCGSRMTMPYGMATLSYEIMHEYFQQDHQTLGEVILAAKRNLARNRIENDYRQMIESMGQAFSPNPQWLPLERHEHLLMFHLLGDPLLRVPRPGTLDLQAELAEPRLVEVTGNAPEPGRLIVEVCYQRDRLRFRHDRRKSFETDPKELAAFEETYRRSNDLVCVAEVVQVPAGDFRVELAVPSDASGDCHVRGFLAGDRQAWAQAVPLTLR